MGFWFYKLRITSSKALFLSTISTAAFSNTAFRMNISPSKRVSHIRQVLGSNDEAISSSKSSGDQWDQLWKDGVTPWDLGGPTAVLQNELLQNKSINFQGTSMRSLVPGCGSGYDLYTILNLHESKRIVGSSTCTSTIVGLDISPTSLERSHQILSQLLSESTIKDISSTIQLYHGDFFGKMVDWTLESSLGTHSSSNAIEEGGFDFIFDYTFFCALHPSLRCQWGQRMAHLLKPKGLLLTLVFPIFTEDSPELLAMEGPPFPVTMDAYKKALEPVGFEMMDGSPSESDWTVSRRKGKELVCWWQKK